MKKININKMKASRKKFGLLSAPNIAFPIASATINNEAPRLKPLVEIKNLLTTWLFAI